MSLSGSGSAITLVVLLSPFLAGALSLPPLSVALVGVALFLALVFTFALGLLQGLARFVWMGGALIAPPAHPGPSVSLTLDVRMT